MQEKDIRRKLNQELDEMAPDILNSILSKPVEPIKDEKELFGKNKPLFKEKKSIRQYLWAPAMVAVAACLLFVIMYAYPNKTKKDTSINNAFSITIDVNPSISIEVDENGNVTDIKAENKDAKKIVKKVKNKIDGETNYNKVLKVVVRKLKKKGYLNKKKNGMLISVVSDDKTMGKQKLREVKAHTKKVQKKQKIKCKTIYQNCVKTEELIEIAKKNKVSVGKAAFCKKLSEKENISVKEMCKKKVYDLIEVAEQDGVVEQGEFIIDEPETVLESESYIETESVLETESTTEIESISETESMQETESISEPVSFYIGESITEEQSIVPTTK